MSNLKDMLSSEDPELIAQSLELLTAFREIKDPKLRQTVSEFARALRPDGRKVAPKDREEGRSRFE